MIKVHIDNFISSYVVGCRKPVCNQTLSIIKMITIINTCESDVTKNSKILSIRMFLDIVVKICQMFSFHVFVLVPKKDQNYIHID